MENHQAIENIAELEFNLRLFFGLLQTTSCKELLILGYASTKKDGFSQTDLCGPFIQQLLNDIIQTPPDNYHVQPWFAYLTNFQTGNFGIIDGQYRSIEELLKITREPLAKQLKDTLQSFARDFFAFRAGLAPSMPVPPRP